MPERIFLARDDALSYAKHIAVSTRTMTKVTSGNGVITVSGPMVESEDKVEELLQNHPQSVMISESLSSIQTALENGKGLEDVIQMVQVTATSVSMLSNLADTIELSKDYKNLLQLYLPAINDCIEAMEEKEYAKSKEHAIDLAFRFVESAERLEPFPLLAQRLRTEAKKMANRSTTLASETKSLATSNLQRRINHLEAQQESCKCGRRRKLWEGKFGFFWGCSTFPSCFFSKRSLSPNEDRYLNGEDKEFNK